MGLNTGWQGGTGPFFVDGSPVQTPPDVVPWWSTDDDDARKAERHHAEALRRQATEEALFDFWDFGTEPIADLPVVPWWTEQVEVRAEFHQPSYGLEQFWAGDFTEATQAPPLPPTGWWVALEVALDQPARPEAADPFWAWSSTEVAGQDALSEIGFIGLGDDLVRPGPVQWPDLFVGTTTEATAPPAVPDFGWVGLGDDCLRPLAADQSDVWIGKPDEVEAAPETAFLPETDDLKTEAASIARLRQAANRQALEFLAWSTVTPETLPAFGWLILGDDIIRPVPRGESEIWGVFTSALEVAGAPVKGPTKAAVLTGRGFVLMRGQTRTKVRVDNPEVVVLG